MACSWVTFTFTFTFTLLCKITSQIQKYFGLICAKDTPISKNNDLNTLYSNPQSHIRYVLKKVCMNIGESMKLLNTNSSLLYIITGLKLSTAIRRSSQHFCFVFARSRVILAPQTVYLPETFRSFLRYLQTRTDIQKLHHKNFLPNPFNLLFFDHIFM